MTLIPHRANGRPSVAPAAWGRAHRWWNAGVPSHEIGRRLGVTGQAVRAHAAKRRWKPRRGKQQGANAFTKLVVSPVTVRCHECGRHRTMTLEQPVACACGVRGAA